MVAICDHLFFLLGVQPEHEVVREAVRVALDLLVETLRRHAVQLGEIGIQHHLLPANQEDHPVDPLRRNQRFLFSHGSRSLS